MKDDITYVENLELLNDLETIDVALENLHVNHNNPRIMGKKRQRTVSDKRIPEKKVQESIIEEMKKDDLNDIIEKVRKFGFLPIDKILVRPFSIDSNKYLVLGRKPGQKPGRK